MPDRLSDVVRFAQRRAQRILDESLDIQELQAAGLLAYAADELDCRLKAELAMLEGEQCTTTAPPRAD